MTKKCVICNSEFEAKREDAEVCSAACRQKNWRKKKEAGEITQIPVVAPKEEIEEMIKAQPPTNLIVDEKGLKEQPKQMEPEEKMTEIREMMAKINKDYGEGTIMYLGDKPLLPKEVIPTGSLGLNIALGIGGLPRGRIVEMYGAESSGKTTIALSVIAEAQKQGLKCAFIDAEQSFEPIYAEKLGVQIDKLFLCQPDYGEQALEVADAAIISAKYGVVVIDSVAALIPKAELEGEMGDSKMGLQARLMSQACRKMVGSISKSNTLVIFINQLRAVIGNMWGPQEITTGGNALKFYASIRLEVRIGALIKDGEEVMGRRIKIKVAKSKVAPPYKTAELDIMYGKGIDKMGEIVEIGSALGIITKSGSWYSYKEDKLGQGKDNASQLLEDNPELLEKILKEINEKL
jgi:recombination protein RecA